MRARIGISMCLVVWAAACGPASPEQRTYTLQGQILAIDASHQQATIKHDEINGFMSAMTMPYKLKDQKLLDGLQPGDVIKAQLVVVPNDAYLAAVTKIGTAPLEPTNADPVTAAATAPAVAPLQAGDVVPDAHFVDQDGRTRAFASFKGAPVVITFMYTRCPVPTFCPLMDHHF